MKKILTIVLTIFMLVACSNQKQENGEYSESTSTLKQTIHYVSPIASKDGAMVLPLSANCGIINTDPNKADKMSETFDSMIVYYHKMLDPTNEFEGVNNIKTINDNYGLGPVEVDKELIEIIKEAINLSKLTLGYFNPTVGVVSNIWKNLFNAEHVNSDPDSSEIEEAITKQIPYELLDEYIVIDEEEETIEFKKYKDVDEIIIDLGAFSKGYVLDKIYDKLMEFKCGFLIVAGGSSIISYTPDYQNGLSWKISENNPNDSSSSIYIINLDTSFISTSGDYEQYFINEDGIRRHHIINPYTGYSENNYRAICLIADKNAGIVDGLTTAMFNLPQEKLDEVIKNVEDYYNMDIKKALIKGQDEFTLVCDEDYLNMISSNEIKDIIITK